MDSLATPARARSSLEIAQTFPKTTGLALVEHGTRCGAKGCRCTRGELHPTAYLRWREHGRQYRRYVRQSDRDAVRAILDRRRQERFQERFDHAVGMMTWRQIVRQLEAIEARIREERKNR
jgi:hypothetical protein